MTSRKERYPEKDSESRKNASKRKRLLLDFEFDSIPYRIGSIEGKDFFQRLAWHKKRILLLDLFLAPPTSPSADRIDSMK